MKVVYSSTAPASNKTLLKVTVILLAVTILLNTGVIFLYNRNWKEYPTVTAEVLSTFAEEDTSTMHQITYKYDGNSYTSKVHKAALTFKHRGSKIKIKVNPSKPYDVYYGAYEFCGFILLRQEDSDLYRSGMNCRQPVRAENCLTSQKCNDTI